MGKHVFIQRMDEFITERNIKFSKLLSCGNEIFTDDAQIIERTIYLVKGRLH